MSNLRVIKLADVKEITGLSRSSIYRKMSEKCFPGSIPLGGKAVGWIEAEVQQWILERMAERDL